MDAEHSSSGRCDFLGGEVGIGCAGGELRLGKRPEGNMRWDQGGSEEAQDSGSQAEDDQERAV